MALVALVVGAACSGAPVDEYVGAACRDDRDCAERCEQGGEFPGGFCTLSCVDDRDCPDSTICMGMRGGVCMFPCEVNGHCDFLGRAYTCKDKDDYAGVRVGVCIGE